jgi:mevalonate kinase
VATGSASGKIILFGEHAVVYGRPALAAPLRDLRARVRVQERSEQGIIIHAPALHRTVVVETAPADDALAAITRATLAELNAAAAVGLELWIESDIPLASGLGSGAAVSTALVRALSAYLARPLSPEQISALVYETEKLYHGTPSGIDNTVIALEQAIRFTRAGGPQPIHLARPFTLVIAHTGIASPTKITVGDVRRAWEREPARYEKIFDEIAGVVNRAEAALARGANAELGALMNRNQELLRELDVSSLEIEKLLEAARRAGARGGKLSGGGRGGNVIVYAEEENPEGIRGAVLEAGAASVLITTVGAG